MAAEASGVQCTGWLLLGRRIDLLKARTATSAAVVVDDALCKPHRPVRLYLRANPRGMVVRTLKQIGTLEAKLPHGPQLKHNYDMDGVAGMTNDERHDLFVASMEMEVASLMGLDIAGIDLLFDGKGYKICEANSSPGFRGLEAACSVNMARQLLAYMMLRLGRSELYPELFSADERASPTRSPDLKPARTAT